MCKHAEPDLLLIIALLRRKFCHCIEYIRETFMRVNRYIRSVAVVILLATASLSCFAANIFPIIHNNPFKDNRAISDISMVRVGCYSWISYGNPFNQLSLRNLLHGGYIADPNPNPNPFGGKLILKTISGQGTNWILIQSTNIPAIDCTYIRDRYQHGGSCDNINKIYSVMFNLPNPDRK